MDDLSYDDMRVTLATWTGRQTMTPARRRDIAGLFEAVIARAEAAATERNTAARRAFAEAENQRLQRELSAAEARAAELAETLENIICALGLNPVDFSDELTEPVITGGIGALQQRVTELERANDEAARAYLNLKKKDDANGEPLREAHRQNMILTARAADLQAAFDVALDRVGELQAELAAERAAHRWQSGNQPLEAVGAAEVIMRAWHVPAPLSAGNRWVTQWGHILPTDAIIRWRGVSSQEPPRLAAPGDEPTP